MVYTEDELLKLKNAELTNMLLSAPFNMSKDDVKGLRKKAELVVNVLQLQKANAKKAPRSPSRGRAASTASTPAARGRSTSRKATASSSSSSSSSSSRAPSRGRSAGRAAGPTIKVLKERLAALGITEYPSTLKADLAKQLEDAEQAAARRATPRSPVFSSARRVHVTQSTPEPVSTPLSFSPATPQARGRSPARTPLPAFSPRYPSPPRTSPSPARRVLRPSASTAAAPTTAPDLPSPWFALVALLAGVAVYFYLWLTTPHDPAYLAAELATAAATASAIARARVRCDLGVQDVLHLGEHGAWAPAWLSREIGANKFPNEILELARTALNEGDAVEFVDDGSLRFTATTERYPLTDLQLTVCRVRRAAWDAVTASPATAAAIVVVAVLSAMLWARRRTAAARSARVDELTRSLFSLLQRQAAIAASSPAIQPWILSHHARDLLLASTDTAIWPAVEAVVDTSSLVAVQPRLVDGAQQDVWEWIGPPAATT
jgi:hypothetical protein